MLPLRVPNFSDAGAQYVAPYSLSDFYGNIAMRNLMCKVYDDKSVIVCEHPHQNSENGPESCFWYGR